MASTAQVVETEGAQAAAPKASMTTMLIVMVLTVLLTVGGVAGVLLYLAKAGRLGGGAAAAAPAKAEETKVPAHALAMEPLLVNLADADGHSYLRVGITLEVADPPKKKGEKEGEAKDGKVSAEVSAPLRDAVLAVLGRQRSEDLLAPDGKERLKRELKASLAEHASESKVTELYFTDFLVQR
jgi:flagellar FliL protein